MIEYSLPESSSLQAAPLGYDRHDTSGWMQRARGKQNIEYTSPDGTPFFAKYCNLQDSGRDNVAGMVNEKKILDKLANTGVTPKAGEVKLYPNTENPTKARFLLERFQAIPLAHSEIGRDSEFAVVAANDVLVQSAVAYNAIQEAGIVQVDVNPGNIMLQKNDQGNLEVKLVDFELAVDLDAADELQLQRAYQWFLDRDNTCALEGVSQVDSKLLRQVEVSEWARMMCDWLLGPSYTWENLKTPSFENLNLEQQNVAKKVKARAIERAKESYARSVESGYSREDWGEVNEIQYALDNSVPHELAAAFISDTLDERLKEKGYSIDDTIVQFLKRALSPNLKDRPGDFSELLLPYNSEQSPTSQ